MFLLTRSFTVVLLRRNVIVMSMGGARMCLEIVIVFGYPFFCRMNEDVILLFCFQSRCRGLKK